MRGDAGHLAENGAVLRMSAVPAIASAMKCEMVVAAA